MSTYKIYTDGSTLSNGSTDAVGGWAFVLLTPDGEILSHNSGGEIGTTNQRMELTAAISALKSGYVAIGLKVGHEVELYSDSAYLINCYTQGWWKNWEKNGWKNSKREPVANQDLWEQLIPFFKNEQIKWIKVKGHLEQKTFNGKWNDFVDKLAQKASENMSKRS